MTLELHLNPPKAVAEVLSQGIIEFNRSTVPGLEPNDDEVRFHILATDDDGELRGGLRGSCYWNTLHIELLWLSIEARGTGIGKEVIERAERYAVEIGCENALVETTSWQARPFYEKLGYSLMATLEGRPKGQASHYLSKKLNAASG